MFALEVNINYFKFTVGGGTNTLVIYCIHFKMHIYIYFKIIRFSVIFNDSYETARNFFVENF